MHSEIYPTISSTIETALRAAGMMEAAPIIANRPSPASVGTISDPRRKAWARAALVGEADKLACTGDGDRANQLFRSCCALGKHFHHGLLDYDEVLTAMVDACRVNGQLREIGPAGVRHNWDNAVKVSGNDELPEMEERNDMPPTLSEWPKPQPADVYVLPSDALMARPLLDVEFDGNKLPPSEPELIKNLLPDGAGMLCGLYGQSGMGKTFVAIQEAVCLASGTPFFDMICRNPRGVGVIYVAAEGAGTIDERVYAAKLAMGMADKRLSIAKIKRCPNLMEEAGRVQLIATVKHTAELMPARLAVIFIDTVTSAFGLDDEDSNSEATRVSGFMKDIGRATGTVVVYVHHFGKDQSKGARGASAWRDHADQALSLTGDRDGATGAVSNRKLSVYKTRTAVEGPFCCFDLKEMDLGTNLYLEPRNVCVAYRTDGDPAAKKASKGRTTFDEAFDAARDKGSVLSNVDGGQQVTVAEASVRDEFMSRYPAQEGEGADERTVNNNKRSAWHREIKKQTTVGGGYVLKDAMIWRRVPVGPRDAFPTNVIQWKPGGD